MDIGDIERELSRITERNRRVEEDKAWETSTARKCLVAALTYAVVWLFFWTANLPHPFLSAIVPTAGFMLSTLSLTFFKRLWVYYRK